MISRLLGLISTLLGLISTLIGLILTLSGVISIFRQLILTLSRLILTLRELILIFLIVLRFQPFLPLTIPLILYCWKLVISGLILTQFFNYNVFLEKVFKSFLAKLSSIFAFELLTLFLTFFYNFLKHHHDYPYHYIFPPSFKLARKLLITLCGNFFFTWTTINRKCIRLRSKKTEIIFL